MVNGFASRPRSYLLKKVAHIFPHRQYTTQCLKNPLFSGIRQLRIHLLLNLFERRFGNVN